MKLLAGTAQSTLLLDQIGAVFPGRLDEIEQLRKRAALGVEITVAPMRRRHSDSQRGLYWSSLHQFGRHLGYSAPETESLLHPVICAQAFGVRDHKEIVCRGERYSWPVPTETSSKDADGRVRDVETYGHLIEALMQFAAEYGYVIER